MKKIFPILLLSCGLSIFFNKPFAANHSIKKTQQEPYKKIHVTGTVTLSGGCVVKYDLVLDISILSASFNGMTGTLTFSGNCSVQQTVLKYVKAEVTAEKTITNLHIEPVIFKQKTLQDELEKALETICNESKPFSEP